MKVITHSILPVGRREMGGEGGGEGGRGRGKGEGKRRED